MLRSEAKSMKKFLFIWAGQFFSILGSGISAFGLSIWVLQNTGNTTSFAMTVALSTLPVVIFAPMAGSLADRKNRKNIIIVTDSLDLLIKVLVIITILTGNLKLWIVYILNFVSSALATFQSPAFAAMIPLIVPKDDLERANGLSQLRGAVMNILIPSAAGLLYPVIGLIGLFVVDFLTYLIGMASILISSIPQKITMIEEEKDGKQSVLKDTVDAFNYLKSKAGFLGFLVAASLINFFASMVNVIIDPMVMEHGNTRVLGFVNSGAGIGLLIGGILASVFPPKENKIRIMSLSMLLSGLGLIIMGINPSWYVIGGGLFIAMLPLPFVNGSALTIMHKKIVSEYHGRIFSLVGAVSQMLVPIGAVCAGLLSDGIFIPLLREDGALSHTFVGDIIGTGATRGMGLLSIVCGFCVIAVCIYLFTNKTISSIETRLPDVE